MFNEKKYIIEFQRKPPMTSTILRPAWTMLLEYIDWVLTDLSYFLKFL
jgi:hypothetical protein